MKICKLAVLSLFCLSACTAETPAPLPTIEPIRIAITPALAPLGVALQACATVQADTALLVDTIPSNKLDLTDIDLAFRLEESQTLPGFVAPIAWESLQVVFHPGLGNVQPDESELVQLFSGQITNWSELGREDINVEVWVPLAGADQRAGFEYQFLNNPRISPLARLAPSPPAMLEAVAQTPGSIGFLPAAWDTGDLRSMPLEINLPVLAMAAGEPIGPAHDLLVCLQSEAGQQILSQSYTPLNDIDNRE